MISVDQAWRHILDALSDPGTESVSIRDAAGRVLRQTIHAERDQPPFDRVMMDGIAIRHRRGETRRFRIRATQHAGDVAVSLDNDRDCIEIMTGAVLPPGADTVVPVERITIADGHAALEEGYTPETGQFVHRRASDHAIGTELMSAGRMLGAPEVAVLASQGLADVRVGCLPAVAVVSTGNELVGPERPVGPHEIRLSNGPAILASLLQHGYTGSRHLHLRDEPAVMRQSLGDVLEDHPVLVLSGGVSRGKADYVPEILADLGVEVIFHRVSQRPGKPMWFGVRDERLVFALPGNPVSALVCFRRYVLPALLTAAGLASLPDDTAVLGADYEFRPALTGFLPVTAATDPEGRLVATPSPTNTSGDFTALAGTSGFVELELQQDTFPAGTPVPLHRWRIA